MIKKGSPLLRCYCFTVDLLKACFLSNHLQWGGPHITACIDSCHLFSLPKVPRSGSIRFPHTDSLSLTHKQTPFSFLPITPDAAKITVLKQLSCYFIYSWHLYISIKKLHAFRFKIHKQMTPKEKIQGRLRQLQVYVLKGLHFLLLNL